MVVRTFLIPGANLRINLDLGLFSLRNFSCISNIEINMENLTLHLSNRLMAEVARVSKEEGLSESAFAERALKYYLFESRFADLHPRMVRHASEMGVYTDEDV